MVQSMTARRSLFDEPRDETAELLAQMAVVVRVRRHQAPDSWEALACGPIVKYGKGETPLEAMRAALDLQVKPKSARRAIL